MARAITIARWMVCCGRDASTGCLQPAGRLFLAVAGYARIATTQEYCRVPGPPPTSAGHRNMLVLAVAAHAGFTTVSLADSAAIRRSR